MGDGWVGERIGGRHTCSEGRVQVASVIDWTPASHSSHCGCYIKLPTHLAGDPY